MKRFRLTHLLYWFLQFTWGLPQNLAGLVLFLALRFLRPAPAVRGYHGAVLTEWGRPYSAGLGMFIFFGHGKTPGAEEIRAHEFGHTVQSVILGPLFLPVIGLPSAVWAFAPCFVKLRRSGRKRYSDFYPEGWADRLGRSLTRRA